MVWPRQKDARGENTKINYGLDTTGEKEKRAPKKNVDGRSTSSHDNKKFRTRAMEKQRGMAFRFRKTATAVKRTGQTDRYIIKPTRCSNSSNLFFGIKLYMFRTVPLSIIRSFSLCTQQWCMSYRLHLHLASRIRTFLPDPARNLSANLYDIHHCCMYSEKLLMMDRGTVRNM